jgi:hypothetical protein
MCVYDLISDTLCITTPVLDKCVKSIMDGMFTNTNYRKKRKKNVFKIFANTKIIDFNHTGRGVVLAKKQFSPTVSFSASVREFSSDFSSIIKGCRSNPSY